MPAQNSYQNKTKHIIPIAVLLIVIIAFAYGAWIAFQYELDVSKSRVRRDMQLLTQELSTLVNRQIDQSMGLAIYQMDQPNLTYEDLTNYSEKLFQRSNSLFSLVALTEDTTIHFVYPLEGNEILLGLDLMSLSEQSNLVAKAKKRRRTIVTPPVDLVEGGRGIICRIPMLSYQNGIPQNFIGLLNIVINFDHLLGQSGVLEATKTYDIKIHESINGRPIGTAFFETSSAPLDQPVMMPVEIQENTWILQVTPKDGWKPASNSHILILAAGLIAALATAFYAQNQLQSQTKLNETVTQRTSELIQTNTYLEESLATIEQKRAEMEVLNSRLEQSVENLEMAQDQLIQSEKLAALGELVAGVAHEINTPLGVGITLTSFVKRQHAKVSEAFLSQELTKTTLSDYFVETEDALSVMDSSLHKAADIVRSFKNVAAEQSHLEVRLFNVSEYIQDVLINLKPKLKDRPIQINVNCDSEMEIRSYPGALSHILTNFIMNSLIHGYKEHETGVITIIVTKDGKVIRLIYQDNGRGIPLDLQHKIYNPFFTTNRSSGGSGLGLHIVHNTVSQVLDGHIDFHSEVGRGTTFTIFFNESNMMPMA